MAIRKLLLLVSLAFSAPAVGQSLLWQIDGNGLKEPSYLFGTLHMGRQKVIDFDSTVMEKVQACEAFAMELDPDGYETYDLFGLLIMPDSLQAINYLDSDKISILDSALNTLGNGNNESLKAFYPLILSTLFAQAPSKNEGSLRVSVDIYLRQRAQWHGLTVYSLEKLEEQAAVFKAVPISEQYKELLSVAKGVRQEEDLTLLENYYLNQQLDSLYHYTLNSTHWSNGMDSLLLDQRNAQMLERMLAIMETQTVFTAVGAAHLSGKKGLIALFQEQGFQVKPVKFQFNK